MSEEHPPQPAAIMPTARLDRRLAALLRPELASLADEIVEEIRRSVPEFARPLQGQFGAGLRLGVEQGLRQFVDQIDDPSAPQEQGTKVYRALGRGEYLEGRSLDALQAAYRVGARVAWRHFVGTCHDGDVEPEQLYVLAEVIFAYIEEIAAHSVHAYAELSARTVGTVERRRRRLLELLLADPPIAGGPALAQLARDAQWRPPRTIACIALDTAWQEGRLPPALGPDVLMDLERADPYLLLPDPGGPGRLDGVRRALQDAAFAVGPAVPLPDAAVSLRLARSALGLMRRGIIAEERHVLCDEHLTALLLFNDEALTRILVQRGFTGFAGLRAEHARRLADTLATWLGTGGSAPDIGTRLNVHPQTVRYRLHQLEDLFGADLRDPEWRFAMQLALHADRLISDEKP